MEIKLKRLFVLDIDGTLIDSTSVHQKAFLNAVSDLVGPVENTDWSSYLDHTDSGIFRDILKQKRLSPLDEKTVSSFDEKIEAFLNQHIIHSPLFEIDGAKKFLNLLESQNIPYCFATGSMRKAAILKLQTITSYPNLAVLTTANEFQTREEIVSEAITQAKQFFNVADFDEIISVGDGIWDFRTAKNLNLKFWGIGNRLDSLVEKEEIFKNFNEVLEQKY